MTAECCPNPIQKLVDNQQFHRQEKQKQRRETGKHPSKRPGNIPEVPFHKKTFNSQILIRPKLKLQSWITEELNKEHTSRRLPFLQSPLPTADFICCRENDTCNQKLQGRHRPIHYRGGEKGRICGGFSTLNQKKYVLEKGKQNQENLS